MARNKWIEHVNEVRKQNSELSLKEVLILAKKTYRKKEDKRWWEF